MCWVIKFKFKFIKKFCVVILFKFVFNWNNLLQVIIMVFSRILDISIIF